MGQKWRVPVARYLQVSGKLVAICAFLFSVALCGGIDAAARPNLTERITDFSSDIRVGTTGDITVRERISVFAYGRDIQRGIFRDIPYVRTSILGFYEQGNITVNSVLRDGKPEPFVVRDFGSYVRIRIGNPDRHLVLGDHVYEITYSMSDQITFGSGIDELYWNVTGNGWRFWIDHARVTVHLPDGARSESLAVYTGKTGEQGTNFDIISESGNTIEAKTFGRLNPYEGLTIAVSWPSGFVKPSDRLERAQDFVLDNKGILSGFALTVLLVGYLWWSWNRFGRDPAIKTVIPLFKPPEGLSAAEIGFLWRRGNSDDGFVTRAFAVILTSLAVKKKLTIEVTHQDTYILKRLPVDNGGLSDDEVAVLERLLPQDGNNYAAIGDGYNENLYDARVSIGVAFDRQHREKYIKHNRGAWKIGCIIAVLAVLATTLLDPLVGAHGAESLVASATISVVFVVGANLIFNLLQAQWKKLRRRGAIGLGQYFGFVLTCIGFAAPVFVIGYLAIGFVSPIPIIIAFIAIAICCLCYGWLEVPTKEFNELYAQILGYRRYLSVAEETRLNFKSLNAQDLIELFEFHLPYAMALEVEDIWSSRFENALAKVAPQGGDSIKTYKPVWYNDPKHGWHGLGTFGHRSGNYLSASAVSYGAPVASTAGIASANMPGGGLSGGGGFSGGGGGGGGGGGW